MKLIHLKWLVMLLLTIAFASMMCKSADLRTTEIKKQGATAQNSRRGKAILEECLNAMNMATWENHPTYEAIFTDRWEKQLGLKMSPWQGENGAKIRMRCALNTFDSQVDWLEGQKKGEILGIQSWQLYRQSLEKPAEKIQQNKAMSFILPTMQYFIELPKRLSQASIVLWAGEKAVDGQVFDLVFVSWDSPEPNRHDQYLLYINRQNKRLERVAYTIRDNFVWTPKFFFGTAYYSDFRQVESIWLPFKMDVYPFDWHSKMKVHTFQMEEFSFDAFPLNTLYPFPDLEKMGDRKQ